MKMVAFYRGKKKNNVPPHLFYIADNAYASMLKGNERLRMQTFIWSSKLAFIFRSWEPVAADHVRFVHNRC